MYKSRGPRRSIHRRRSSALILHEGRLEHSVEPPVDVLSAQCDTFNDEFLGEAILFSLLFTRTSAYLQPYISLSSDFLLSP